MSAGRRLFTAGLLAASVLSAIAVPASAVAPTITKLTPLPNGTLGGANDINDSGVIVGTTHINSFNQAARWSPDGAVSALTPLPGRQSGAATAINTGGTIVGYQTDAGGWNTATRWAPDGTVEALATAPDYLQCVAYAVNDSGVVAGTCSTTGFDSRAVRWAPDGTVELLPLHPDRRNSEAFGINASGAIVGAVHTSSFSNTKAVRWNPDGSVDVLADLPDAVGSKATAINDSGTIAGTVVAPGPDSFADYAVRWSTDGTVAALPAPSGVAQPYAQPTAISPDGTIVGTTKNAANKYVAATWSPSGALTILPLLAGDDFSQAAGINKRNMTVGSSAGKAVRWSGTGAIACAVKPICGS